MWSGPRTVSTALMRSFENRPDTVVVDEPLYAYYLAQTGIDHPGRDEIIASMPTDWRTVLTELATAPLPAGASVYYQKHMTHHLLEDIDRDALAGLTHAFLIRDPRRLLTSYARVRSRPVLADLGLAQQVEIFRAFGGPVIDSADILRAPRRRWRRSVMRSASPSTRPCCPGPAARGRPMASGHRIGTTACGGRRDSARPARQQPSTCRRTWRRWRHSASRSTKSWPLIGYGHNTRSTPCCRLLTSATGT